MTTAIRVQIEIQPDPIFNQIGHTDTEWWLALDPLFEVPLYVATSSIDGVPLTTLDVTVGSDGPIYARAKFIANGGFEVWSEISACAFTDINPPRITLPAGVDVSSATTTPTFNLSQYDPISGSGSHVDTDWIITTPDIPLNTVWASVRDAVNLYSITVPNGILTPNTEYVLMAGFNGQFKNGTYGFMFFNTGA